MGERERNKEKRGRKISFPLAFSRTIVKITITQAKLLSPRRVHIPDEYELHDTTRDAFTMRFPRENRILGNTFPRIT